MNYLLRGAMDEKSNINAVDVFQNNKIHVMDSESMTFKTKHLIPSVCRKY